jgi:WD40 repeat protein
MSMLTSKKPHTPVVKPFQTMRGHTDSIQGVEHLHDGQRIITCSKDCSLRLWDLQNGTQIGDDWRDEEDDEDDEEYEYEEHEMYEFGSSMWAMALSPSGNTVASGSHNGTVSLWDVETPGKVIAKWAGHRKHVRSVCWRPDGERVAVGFTDGIAGVWDIKNGKTVPNPIMMKTGHESVAVVIYSPDSTKLATGGYGDITFRIWDAKIGEAIFTHEYEQEPFDGVFSLTWTTDEKKFISGFYDGIFDTATHGRRLPFWKVTKELSIPSPCFRASASSQVHPGIKQCVSGISTRISLLDRPFSMKMSCRAHLLLLMESCWSPVAMITMRMSGTFTIFCVKLVMKTSCL